MPAKWSDAVRNAMLDAETTILGASPQIRFYGGTPPADESTALSGNTQLGQITLAPAAAAAGSKNFIPSAVNDPAADASGVCTFYRLTTSGGVAHEQGLVSQPHAGSTAYVTGQQVHNAGNVYRATTGGTTAAATPPTGTGGSITDGTVTWAFVQAGVDLVLDNTNLVINQQINMNGFTRTAPG